MFSKNRMWGFSENVCVFEYYLKNDIFLEHQCSVTCTYVKYILGLNQKTHRVHVNTDLRSCGLINNKLFLCVLLRSDPWTLSSSSSHVNDRDSWRLKRTVRHVLVDKKPLSHFGRVTDEIQNSFCSKNYFLFAISFKRV